MPRHRVTDRFAKSPSVTLAFMLSGVFLTIPCQAGSAANDTSLEKVVETIDRLSGRITSVKWKATRREGTLNDKGEFVPGNSPVRCDSDVIFEPTIPRFHSDVRRVERWIQGSAPYLSKRNRVAFDGKRLVDLDREIPGARVPGENQGTGGTPDGVPWTGTIEPDTANYLRENGWNTGLGYFNDRYWNKRITDRIRRELSLKAPVTVTEVSAGIWQIEMVERGVDNDRHRLRVEYDSNKGAITQIIRLSGEPKVPWQRIDITLQQVDGLWVPRSMLWVKMFERPVLADQVLFVVSEINRPVEPKIYGLSPPPGTQMVDHVAGKAFVVGQGATSEAEMIAAFTEGYARGDSSNSWWSNFNWIRAAAVVGAMIGGTLVIRWRNKLIAG